MIDVILNPLLFASCHAASGRVSDSRRGWCTEVSGRVWHHHHHGAHRGGQESVQWSGGRPAETDELRFCPYRPLRLHEAILHPRHREWVSVSEQQVCFYCTVSSWPTYVWHTGAGIVTRLMAGCTTGAMAVAFAQPTDVVKVRFQAQVRLADGERRYNGTIDAYKTIARDEGVRGLWRGTCFTFKSFIFIWKCPRLFWQLRSSFVFQDACQTSLVTPS